MGNVFGSEGDILANCCCDVKLVILASKNIEHVLEKDFGATGRGLHEKITSAKELPDDLKRKLRKIATIRNKLIHEVGYDEVENKEQFKEEFRSAIRTLSKLAKERGHADPFGKCVIC